MITAKELINVKETPTYNQVGWIPNTRMSYTTTQKTNYKRIIKYMKRTPEAIGILRAIQTDILSDGYTFKPINIDKRGSGKSKLEKVKSFCKKNGFKVELGACVFDWLMLGNGALWVGDISDSNFFKEVADKLSAIKHIEIKETEVKAWADEANYDKKVMRSVAWSTMNIDLDKELRTIKGYRQIVAGRTAINFTPDEIIHAKFMHFDGKAYGFSPIEASINIISTLSLIKDLHGNFFVNGGVPDWLFVLPREMAGSPNVELLEQNLKTYKKSSQKGGNLVFTGEVESTQLNKFDKDMEFQKLAIYYTGILALAFNMPMARVAAIIGAQVKQNASATDLSEAGYWRSISSAQDYWEDLLNTQLFEPEFGVQIKFNRGYKNDEIKEAQRDVQQFEVIDKLIERGAVRTDYAKTKLHIPDEYWTGKWEKPEPFEMGSPFGGKPGDKNQFGKKDEKGTAGQAKVEQKREQAVKAADRKEIEMKEMEKVDLVTFDRLVTRWVKTSSTRKVNWYEKDGNYYMRIHTPDISYFCSVPIGQLSPVKKSDWLYASGIKSEWLGSDESKIAAEEKKLLSLSGKRNTLKQTISLLEERQAELVAGIGNSKNELKKLGTRKSKADEKLIGMVSEVEMTMKNKLAEMAQQMKDYQAKLSLMVNDIEKTKEDLDTLKGKKQAAEEETEKAKKKAESEKKKVIALENAKKKLKEEI